MISRLTFLTMLFLFGGVSLRADLETVKKERKPNKRAEKAIKNADKALTTARKAYMEGENETLESALQEVYDSVKLAYESLKSTGKDPRKNARPYKKAEIGTRKLLRRLDSFQNEMSYLDRERIEDVIAFVRETNQNLLHDVMGVER